MTGFLRNLLGGDKANDAQVAATDAALQGQQGGLDWLKQSSAVENAVGDRALWFLNDYYQNPGQPKDPNVLLTEALNSPLYDKLRSTGMEAGQNAILRNASATGGLRSGSTIRNLAVDAANFQNKALLDSYNEFKDADRYQRGINLTGLTGLAGLQGNDEAIASLTANMGATKAGGILGGAQTQLDATNNGINTLMGLGQLLAFSDIRLKHNIRHLGFKDGFNWYEWDWNKRAQDELGLKGKGQGVIAHEVYDVLPDAIGEDRGYLVVDYSRIMQEAA